MQRLVRKKISEKKNILNLIKKIANKYIIEINSVFLIEN